MGGINVKNTIVERTLQIIAPHLCSGCGKTGTILCDDCKYDIVNEPFGGCIVCGMPQRGGICQYHESPITRAFVTGLRIDTLEVLINRLKFEHTKAAAPVLAELLDTSLPLLPDGTQIIPIPTVSSHVRERGYDHLDLIARQFAVLRGYTYKPVLSRRSRATQHTAEDKATRTRQAQAAFSLTSGDLSRDAPILLLDDIITTGATINAAASLLKAEGFEVWVGAIAYQPLD